MSTEQGNFSVLREQDPFAVGRYSSTHPIDFGIRKLEPTSRAKLLAVRSSICALLNVDSLSEIQTLIQNPQAKEALMDRAYRLLAGLWGYKPNDIQISEIALKTNGYARIADSVINGLKDNELLLPINYSRKLEMVNEVAVKNNPVDLLFILFNDRYGAQAKFEAKRKLKLMELAASIDRRERETQTQSKFDAFQDFLNENVYSRDIKIGETEPVYILSEHDRDNDFICTSFRILNKEEGEKIKPESGQKLTMVNRRTFSADSKKIPIYVTTRQKTQEARVLKLLRKGQENPAIAVDDEMGLLGVLESVRDVDIFQATLQAKAAKTGSLMTLEELTDTLNGGRYHPANTGSSPDVRMRKFFAVMWGMRAEFILHTMETYLDYLYEDGMSHEEYEVKRLFETGVTELLFPRSIYGINFDEIKPQMIERVRRKIREN